MTSHPVHTGPTIYTDGQAIYLEFPGHVLRFAYSEGGFSKALKHVPNITLTPGYVGRPGNVPMSKLISGRIAKIAKSTQRKRAILNVSAEVKAEAADIIRKMGEE